jgi:hypothetical protein
VSDARALPEVGRGVRSVEEASTIGVADEFQQGFLRAQGLDHLLLAFGKYVNARER